MERFCTCVIGSTGVISADSGSRRRRQQKKNIASAAAMATTGTTTPIAILAAVLRPLPDPLLLGSVGSVPLAPGVRELVAELEAVRDEVREPEEDVGEIVVGVEGLVGSVSSIDKSEDCHRIRTTAQ